MPRHVDKLTVGGHRVNFTADLLELRVEILQIRKLRGAHERKVGGIEKEDAPLPLKILPGYCMEVVVLISLYGEVTDFFIDERHGVTFFVIIFGGWLAFANFSLRP